MDIKSGWKFHWSHLRMLLEGCAEQFRRRYIEDDIRPPGVALITGAATHTGIEMDLNTAIETGGLAPRDEIEQVTRDKVRSYFDEGNYRLQGEDPDADEAYADTVEQSQALVTTYHDEYASKVHPLSVERPWVVSLDGYPFDLAGRWDCAGMRGLYDWKTTGRKKSKEAEHRMGQMTMYSLAHYVLEGFNAPLRPTWLVKTKTPYVDSRLTTRDEEDWKKLLRRIVQAWQLIEAGTFPPTGLGSWLCQPKYCGYYSSCPYT